MSNNFRNIQLLQQIPESNPLKKGLAAAFDISDFFKRDVQAIGQDSRWSAQGRIDERNKNLTRALRDMRDLKQPIVEFSKQTEMMRASKKRAAYDKTDVVGAMNRRELRDKSVLMNFGQRSMRMEGPHRDVAFRDAVLEFAPWVSGFDEFEPNELKLYEEAKQEQDRELNGPLQDTIAARESQAAEAMMIFNVTRGDLQLHSEMEPRVFEAFAKPIESKANAPWIKKTTRFDGTEQVTVFEPQPDGTVRNRPATPDEARDGVEHPSLQSYLAARAA